MKKTIAVMVALGMMSSPAWAAAYMVGAYQGWDINNPIAMTETFGGSGIWQTTITTTPGAFEAFAPVSTIGDWNSKFIPSGNQWGFTDGAGNLGVTLDTNAQVDGWLPLQNRIILSNMPTTTWNIVGDFLDELGGVDWDNASPFGTMTLVGGFYTASVTIPVPGTYNGKTVKTGSWDAIGGDGRSQNADNIGFTVDAVNDTAVFTVDPINGRMKIDVIPEPATLTLLALGGLFAARRRR